MLSSWAACSSLSVSMIWRKLWPLPAQKSQQMWVLQKRFSTGVICWVRFNVLAVVKRSPHISFSVTLMSFFSRHGNLSSLASSWVKITMTILANLSNLKKNDHKHLFHTAICSWNYYFCLEALLPWCTSPLSCIGYLNVTSLIVH